MYDNIASKYSFRDVSANESSGTAISSFPYFDASHGPTQYVLWHGSSSGAFRISYYKTSSGWITLPTNSYGVPNIVSAVPNACAYGYAYDGSGICKPICDANYGSHWNGTACVVCDPRWHWDPTANSGLGNCVQNIEDGLTHWDYELNEYVANGCGVGYTFDYSANGGLGMCVVSTPTCSNSNIGYYWNGIACVVCDHHFYWNSNSGTCEADGCATYEHWDYATNQCVADECATYEHWDYSVGYCVDDGCDPHWHWDPEMGGCVQNIELNDEHWDYAEKAYVPNNCSVGETYDYATGVCVP